MEDEKENDKDDLIEGMRQLDDIVKDMDKVQNADYTIDETQLPLEQKKLIDICN